MRKKLEFLNLIFLFFGESVSKNTEDELSFKFVILCGGSGTRLWPESRNNFPKQFVKLFEDKSLLDLTLERYLEFESKVKPLLICNKKHLFLVEDALKFYNLDADIIVESEGKNTTAAIYFASKLSSKTDNLVIMPSDHLFPDLKNFVDDINKIKVQDDFNSWITLGIKPSYPSEAYGYIKVKEKIKNGLFEVIEFIEKPTKKIAVKMIEDDNIYWNSGIFIANSSVIIESITKHATEIAKACENAYNHRIVNNNKITFLDDIFNKIPAKSIDFAVMEFEKKIKLYPLNCQWSDVGSWDTIAKIKGDTTKIQNVIQIDSRNNFIRNNERIIATIGVENLIIIDDDNTTLILKKNHGEKVKRVVQELIRRNLTHSYEHSYEYRPWGKFENLLVNKDCRVKRIIISPNKRLSLQYHNFRSEHWLIVNGTASVFLNGEMLYLSKGQSIDIPVKSKHYVANQQKESLIIIETQLGTYFGEDDIIRLDDPYSR